MSIIQKIKSPFAGNAEKGQKEEARPQKKSNFDPGSAALILKAPHVSERASLFAHKGKYIFKVDSQANKIEIKKAVERLYNVKVVGVNILQQQGKNRQRGQVTGRTIGFKKAIVTLEKGKHIDILPQ